MSNILIILLTVALGIGCPLVPRPQSFIFDHQMLDAAYEYLEGTVGRPACPGHLPCRQDICP